MICLQNHGNTGRKTGYLSLCFLHLDSGDTVHQKTAAAFPYHMMGSGNNNAHLLICFLDRRHWFFICFRNLSKGIYIILRHPNFIQMNGSCAGKNLLVRNFIRWYLINRKACRKSDIPFRLCRRSNSRHHLIGTCLRLRLI